jgi:porphobilinogen deaminase
MQGERENRLRVGTRGSLLARAQTDGIVARLRALHPGLEIVVEIIQTTGDVRRDVPFAQIGTKGMFVKEIEQALGDGRIDLGVHSLKDMPGELPDGLELACIPAREDPRDALLTRLYTFVSARRRLARDHPVRADVGFPEFDRFPPEDRSPSGPMQFILLARATPLAGT